MYNCSYQNLNTEPETLFFRETSVAENRRGTFNTMDKKSHSNFIFYSLSVTRCCHELIEVTAEDGGGLGVGGGDNLSRTDRKVIAEVGRTGGGGDNLLRTVHNLSRTDGSNCRG